MKTGILFVALCCFIASGVTDAIAERATTVQTLEAKIMPLESGALQVCAKFSFNLPEDLDNLLKKGVVLYFVTEFLLRQKRPYWFAKPLVNITRFVRIVYHPLFQFYGVSHGGLQLRFNSLQEALILVKVIHNWEVLNEKQALNLNIKQTSTTTENPIYIAAIRLYLDITRMPKPLQLQASNSPSWNIDSGWHIWNP